MKVGDAAVVCDRNIMLTCIAATLPNANTFEKPELVKPTVFNGAKVKKGQLKITLPAQSIVVLEIK